jgi:hypothetical protein
LVAKFGSLKVMHLSQRQKKKLVNNKKDYKLKQHKLLSKQKLLENLKKKQLKKLPHQQKEWLNNYVDS